MRILVTGAAGLYGVHLVDLFVSRPEVERVFGIDNFSRRFLVDNPFISNPRLSERFELWRQDYRDLTAEAVDDCLIDAVVHLAAFVSIDESMEKPDEYFENNERGTFLLARTLLKTKRRPLLVVASSPEVYGNPLYTPMDEDHPMYPRSFYAVSKLAAEKHCRVLYEWYKYPVVVIRNFNTYGENQNVWGYSAVIPAFIEAALKGRPLVIQGDGSQTRDFLYVKDAARAYWSVLLRGKAGAGEVINLGTGRETSVAELARIILSLTKTRSGIEHRPGRPGDLNALSADIRRAGMLLGWEPQFTLHEGLERTVEWYRRVLT